MQYGGADPHSVPFAHDGRLAHADSDETRASIISIYKQHNPTMLASGEVAKLLSRYHGREDVL